MPNGANPLLHPTLLAALCLAALSAALGAAEPAPSPRIEYLPNIVYEDEAITLCVRVEAPGPAQSAFRLTASLLDAAGEELDSASASGKAAAGTPWRAQFALRAGEGSPASLRLRLAPAGGQGASAVVLRVLSARAPLPPLRVKGMRLVDAAGQRVLVRIEHRVYKREERWPLVRWLSHQIYGEGWDFSRVLFLGSDLGAPGGGYLARLAASEDPAMSVVAVPEDAEDLGLPVLRAVAALTANETEPDLAVLCLGHGDADFGTDVVEFGRALELLVQQLEGRGCSQFVLVAPLGPPQAGKRLAPYARAASHVAHVYDARYVDIGGELSDRFWAAGQQGGQLVLRWPNAEGQRAIADALAARLAALRR